MSKVIGTFGVSTVVEHPAVMGDLAVAKSELAKFFTLAVDSPTPPGMFSKFIDNLWHRMLQGETPENYASFSIAACGAIVEHVPALGQGEVTWVLEYHKKFGENLPKEWFCTSEGVLDEAAYRAYRQTGEVVASWDCTPVGGDVCKTK